MRSIIPVILALGLATLAPTPAFAQYAPVDPIPMGQTATGVMANKLSGDIARGTTRSRSVPAAARRIRDRDPSDVRWRPNMRAA